eukprot:scaffold91440_cov53-Phaeocystis_antarctica.AAC.2
MALVLQRPRCLLPNLAALDIIGERRHLLSDDSHRASSPSGETDGTPTAKVRIEPIAVSLLAADAPGITTKQSNDVQRVIQSLMDKPWPTWYPKVCISYATGTRKGTDAHGAGPGMLQAAAISHAL